MRGMVEGPPLTGETNGFGMSKNPETVLHDACHAAGLREGVRVGVLCSGGLDSAVLLQVLAARGPVIPFYVACGLAWEAAELDAVDRLIAVLDPRRVSPLIRFSMPTSDLYRDHWSLTGSAVPDATTPDEAVELPGRNALITLKPLLWCAANGVGHLALATLAGNPFADASAGFLRGFSEAVSRGSGCDVSLLAPFSLLAKETPIRGGRPEVLAASLSCLKPQLAEGGWMHCGLCNKCGERRRGFRRAGVLDPALFFDESASASAGLSG
jgi:7-cyano-7-deazaguanine synthase